MRLKTMKRITGLILTVAVFATSVRAEEYATLVSEVSGNQDVVTGKETTVTDEVTEGETAGAGQEEDTEVYILCEDETLREESVKHFAMSDGSMRAVVYSEPVHYKEDGVYKDIDSTLVEVQDTYYKNKAGGLDIYLADNAGSGKLARIKQDKYSISFEYVPVAAHTSAGWETETEGSAKSGEQTDGIAMPSLKTFNGKGKLTPPAVTSGDSVGKETDISKPDKNDIDGVVREAGEAAKNLLKTIDAHIENPKEKEGTLIEKAAAKTTGSVRYEGIKKNCDIEYIISGSGLKEYITLYGKQEAYEYSFRINAESLILEKEADGAISAKDEVTGEEIFTLPAPFMYDSEGNYSDSVTQEMVRNEDGTYLLTISADREWIEAEGRSFPVVIDPAVETATTKDAIDTTFVTSDLPDTNHSTKFEMLAGRESSEYGNCRILVKFTLPTLKKGDMVVSGILRMANYKNGFYSSGTPDLRLNAHMLTGSWNMSTVTWNTQPTYQSLIGDYTFLKRADTEGAWKNFDLTKIVKAWYEGTANNGIVIKPAIESGSYADTGVKGYFWTERYNSTTDNYPYMIIEYRNNKGLENYWTYTSASAGEAGTAYVNDYSGNLVFVHSDAATYGLRSPVAIEHVYNGYQSGSYASACLPYAGLGFRLNIQQRVMGTSLADYPYMYTDGDGTDHYFYKMTEDGATVYRDEDGLGLKLTRNSNGTEYVITDDKDNRMTFNVYGYLSAITDSNGNKITITHNSGHFITTVTDGAGDSLTFGYDGYWLKTITDTVGRVTTFGYTNGRLTSITYPDGTKSTYGYDSSYRLINAASPDGYKLSFSYRSVSGNSQVEYIREYAGNVLGNTLYFNRQTYNVTTITSAGNDRNISTTTDNVITELQFDNYGRTLTTHSYTSTEDFGASTYSYTSGTVNSSGSNAKQINRVSNAAVFGENKTNLARNHSAESSGYWGKAIWFGSSTYTYARSTAESYMGQYSHCINVTALTGDARGRIYQDFATTIVKPGKTYTVSAYVKVKDIKSSGADIYGAGLAVNCFRSDGSTVLLEYSDTVKVSDEAMDDGFRRIELTVTIPTGTTNTRLNLYVRGATGTAYFDCIQVEEGDTAESYNLLENAGFEYISGSTPTDWTRGGNLTSGDSCYGPGKDGSYNYRISGDPLKAKTVSQTVMTGNIEVGETYILSGWVMANAAPNSLESRPFDITVKLIGANEQVYSITGVARFNTTVTGWQYVSVPVVMKAYGTSGWTADRVKVTINYSYQTGYACFDKLQLIKDDSASYTYDSDGNPITVVADATQKSSMEYDDSNLTKTTDAKGYDYSYSYDGKHNLLTATSQNGVVSTYDYNDYGQATSLIISKDEDSDKIKTEAQYTTDGAYLDYTLDADGGRTDYTYDDAKGTLTSVESVNGTVTSYVYNDLNNRLESTTVTSGSSFITVDYEYDSDGYLDKITHNGFYYDFDYDGTFGNRVATKVGTVTLITNTYGSNNGLLNESTYGNGFTKGYTYDTLGNVTAITENGATAYTMKYNSRMQLKKLTDVKTGRTYDYVYDTTDRLVSMVLKGELAVETYYGYDVKNNVDKFVYSVGGKTVTENYTYEKDNLISKVQSSLSEVATDYNYDSLNRLNNTVTTLPSGSLTHSYTYEESDLGTGYTTTKVETETIGNVTYKYTYDVSGNITAISKKTGTGAYKAVASYAYDGFGRLIRENVAPDGSLYSGHTMVYNYDNGGNITKRTEYPYTTGSVGTARDTVAYGYTDSNWKDKLTSYDGSTITYDAIGNPLSYRGYTLTWAGRKLSALTGTGTDGASLTSTYQYDMDGIRTSKTVNGVKHTYYYEGSQLRYEQWGSEKLYFTYDGLGNLSAISHVNGTTTTHYYVMSNSRGDVEYIYNTSGTLVVQYTYDAWGNGLTIKDGSGASITSTTHIGYINPIRYRGYYYDVESGLYYLNSRYYDAEVGRFISADGQLNIKDGIFGCNMFAYCNNNSINYYDPTGESAISLLWSWIIGFATAAVAEPTLIGEIILVSAIVILCCAIVVDKIVTTTENIGKILNAKDESKTSTEDTTSAADTKNENKDSRLKGKPGEIKKDGYKETLIGPDGNAIKERHWSDHGNPKKHSIPHDHNILWNDNGNPVFGPPQNYWDGTIPIFP